MPCAGGGGQTGDAGVFYPAVLVVVVHGMSLVCFIVAALVFFPVRIRRTTLYNSIIAWALNWALRSAGYPL